MMDEDGVVDLQQDDVCFLSEEPLWATAWSAAASSWKDIFRESSSGIDFLWIRGALAHAAWDALSATKHALAAWLMLGFIVGRPIWRLGRAVFVLLYPWARAGTLTAWRWEASLTPGAWVVQACLVVGLGVVFLVQRHFSRRKYLERFVVWVKLHWARAGAAYRQFLSSVERRSRALARVLPHAFFWGIVVVILRLFPSSVMAVTEGPLWVSVTALLPALRALVLMERAQMIAIEEEVDVPLKSDSSKASAGSPSRGKQRRRPSAKIAMGSVPVRPSATPIPSSTSPSHEGDKVLMYWVMLSFAWCSCYATFLLPGAYRLLQWLPHAKSSSFFFLLWLQLPGRAGGLHIAFSVIEPLLHGAPSQRQHNNEGYEGLVGKLLVGTNAFLSALRMVGLLSKATTDAVTVSIADSWLLVPASIFIFTPSFITYAGCLYVGMVVPALNTMKVLQSSSQRPGESQRRRIRWLTYWAVFGVFWEALQVAAPLLAWLPFSTHAQLLALMWLQLPYFHGSTTVVSACHRLLARFLGESDTEGEMAARLQDLKEE